MFKLAGVYKITNVINKKIYIGESEDISRRWVEHLTDLSLNQHCNSKLQTDFNIYGIDSFKFEILESVPIDLKNNNINQFTLKLVLLCREHAYIHECNSIKEGYNIEDTYNELYNNNLDMFVRTKKATENEIEFVHRYMKNHKYLLTNESGITIDTLFVKRLRSIRDLSEKIEKYNNVSIPNSTIKLSDTKNKVKKDELNTNVMNFTQLYKKLKSEDIIPINMPICIFRQILQKHNIIIFQDYSWHITKYSKTNNYIIEGKIQKNTYGYYYNQLLITDIGVKYIYELLNSVDLQKEWQDSLEEQDAV